MRSRSADPAASLRAQRRNPLPLATVRRDCFGAALLATAVLVSPAVAGDNLHCVPVEVVLWGDGQHDDSAALNAWFAGNAAVWAASGEPVGPRIAGRSFRLRDALYVRAGTGRQLDDFRLLWPERGETVSGGAIATGGDPDAEPILSGVGILGGDAGEGVAFAAPDAAPARSDDAASCPIS